MSVDRSQVECYRSKLHVQPTELRRQSPKRCVSIGQNIELEGDKSWKLEDFNEKGRSTALRR